VCAKDRAYGAVTSSKTSISQLDSALGMILTLLVLEAVTTTHVADSLAARGVNEADTYATLTAIEN
jgi:hypothetical protein